MKKDNDKLAYYLPIMISLGVVFGICFDNIGIGICLGVGAAGILSLLMSKTKNSIHFRWTEFSQIKFIHL